MRAFGFLFIITLVGQKIAHASTVSIFDVLVATGGLTAASTAAVNGNAFSVGGGTFVVTAGRVGIGTTTPTAQLHLVGASTSTQKAQLIWFDQRAAIRLGGASAAQWENIGLYSSASGLDNEASGDYATIGGGRDQTASGEGATVCGGGTVSTSSILGNVAAGRGSTIGGGYGNTALDYFSFIGGGESNVADGHSAVINGGALNTTASAQIFQTIGGGGANRTLASYATVCGGYNNDASSTAAVIAGGGRREDGPAGNVASGFGSAVLGGGNNRATAPLASVGGGQNNLASGRYSTVPGGADNTASGEASFAAGRRATAQATGSFVWADSQGMDLLSTEANEFKARASGGFVLLGPPHSGPTVIVSSGALIISTSAAAASAVPNLYISSVSGNLGIGTNAPASTLAVNGSAEFGSGATRSTFTSTGLLKVTSVGIQWADGTTSTTAFGGGGGGDVILVATQTFTGANTFTSSVTVQSAGRDIVFSTYSATGANASARIRGSDGRFEYRSIAVRAYNSSHQSIPHGTVTTLTLDSERWDTNGMHSTSSNTGRLTAGTTGLYSICANTRWATNNTGLRITRIVRNGSTVIAEVRISPALGESLIVAPCTQYELQAGDYVTIDVYQESGGGSLNIEADPQYSPEFSMTYSGGL